MFTNLEHNIILLLVSVDPRPLLPLVVLAVSGWQEVVWQLVGELVTITLHLKTVMRIKRLFHGKNS